MTHPAHRIAQLAGELPAEDASQNFAIAILLYTAALLARDRAEDLAQIANVACELIKRFQVVLEAEELLGLE